MDISLHKRLMGGESSKELYVGTDPGHLQQKDSCAEELTAYGSEQQTSRIIVQATW